MFHSERGPTRYLLSIEILYLLFVVFSFYLLVISRTGEARTVWEVLHPAFIPVLFLTTFALVVILFTSEKVAHKLLFIIFYSILIHSFFSIIFPAGDLLNGQQIVFGRIKRLYDDTALHGWPFVSIGTVQSQLFMRFGGVNFQGGLTIILALMFSIELLKVHLFLVPVLWGVFSPIALYLVTFSFTRSEKVAVLSSLLISTFPYATKFGSISVQNSLGFLFFFFAVYFMLKNLDSDESKTKFLMLTFSFFALLSHYLTGIISLSLLLLTIALKAYAREKKTSSKAALFSVLISFIVSASLLPLSLIYLRFFRADTDVVFTVDKFHGLPLVEVVGQFLFGQVVYASDLKAIFLISFGPLLAFLYLTYFFLKSRGNRAVDVQIKVLFLLTAFLVVIIDYGILTLFMSGLPLNAERLWVFRDFIASPFVALAIYGMLSLVSDFLKAHFPSTTSFTVLGSVSKSKAMRILSLLFIVNVLIPIVLSGWIVSSLSVAYPRVAPLQTTSYELEAVKYIDENTHEKYVVIGDVWTIYAGEVIVGINNPRAYYFGEFDKTGHDLFVNMTYEPSPKLMLHAMNYTNTAAAYFIVTQPRLGTEEFNDVITKALGTLSVFYITGKGKLYIFIYRKE